MLDGLLERPHFGDLPLWRNVSLICVAALFFSLGCMLFALEMEIYASAPHMPVLETQMMYPVRVNHGYLRYVTAEQAERLEFWRTATPAGLVVLLATGLVLATLRYPRVSPP